jgi:hypothetical protein
VDSYHVICECCIAACLSTTAHITEGVEHAGAKEAHECNHAELDLGRGIPGDCELANVTLTVHPTWWENAGAGGLFGVVG